MPSSNTQADPQTVLASTGSTERPGREVDPIAGKVNAHPTSVTIAKLNFILSSSLTRSANWKPIYIDRTFLLKQAKCSNFFNVPTEGQKLSVFE